MDPQRGLILAILVIAASLAGCTNGAEPADSDSGVNGTIDEQPQDIVSRQDAIDYEAHLGTGVCVPIGLQGCLFLEVTPDTNKFHRIELNGTSLSANLTMEWDALSPTMQNLALRIYANDAEEPTLASVVGTSPAILQLDETKIPHNTTGLTIQVSAVGITVGPTFVYQPVEQDVRVTGIVTQYRR